MLAAFLLGAAVDLERVVVDRDDVVIEKSCTIAVGSPVIEDANGDGVIRIAGDGITIDFDGAVLHGAPAGREPDAFAGFGVRITGKNVTLRNAVVSGYKAALWASGADGLVLERCDVSGNFRQRLKSTEKAEDEGDWLWPHQNDQNEWLENYGAGIYVEESKQVTVRSCRARAGQNGLLMRKVSDSLVIDNDFSFLSGWGIGMFRCDKNRVLYNSCDFCVRGYSHGVYARGQDSAGILFFEQNRENVIAYNSATHSGDGFFGFCGLEALEGQAQEPRRGNNRNLIAHNDFSYAPAIGIEMTFSFDNVFAENVLVGSNYGVWGGYSSDTTVYGNRIHDNTIAGIAVEHGADWWIVENDFQGNARAIELWWDEDTDLLSKPWSKLNNTDSRRYHLEKNRFSRNEVDLELRGGTREVFDDSSIFAGATLSTKVDDRSEAPSAGKPAFLAHTGIRGLKLDMGMRLGRQMPVGRQAVGARPELAGRDKIIITEWGPYDWEAPYLQRLADRGAAHAYRFLGREALETATIVGHAKLEVDRSGPLPVLVVSPKADDAVVRYTVKARSKSGELERQGVLAAARWKVSFFPWSIDPRENVEEWRAEAATGTTVGLAELALPFGSGGPSELALASEELKRAALPSDRFGTLAEARLTLPAGMWRFAVTSDDGVRLWVDGRMLVDDWTWHAPKTETAGFELERARAVDVRVEHFELDGHSVLALELSPAP